jgi:hypothetical protein
MQRWKVVSERLRLLRRTPTFDDFETKIARALIEKVGEVLDRSRGDNHLAVWCFRQMMDDVVKIVDVDGGSEADAMAAVKVPVSALMHRARTVWPSDEERRSIRRWNVRWNDDERFQKGVFPEMQFLLWDERRRIEVPGPEWNNGKGEPHR